MDQENVTSLEGPVEKDDGKLVLRIPLSAGGSELIECSRGVGTVEGEYLKIEIQEWLAGILRLAEGDLVNVNNQNGKLNITPVDPRPVQ